MKIDLSKPVPVIDASNLAKYLRIGPQHVLELMRNRCLHHRLRSCEECGMKAS